LHTFNKLLKTAVISLFNLSRKTAGRQFPVFQMIAKAFTAEAFSGTAGIRTAAVLQILFFSAFHHI
jgi:hypothetical protein